MNDRELLEFAARAATYEIKGYDEKTGVLIIVRPCKFQEAWNPLKIDGDAFRLMVDLQFGIEEWKSSIWVWVNGDKNNPVFIEPVGDDKHATTRRAIVMAAAEIGKSK